MKPGKLARAAVGMRVHMHNRSAHREDQFHHSTIPQIHYSIHHSIESRHPSYTGLSICEISRLHSVYWPRSTLFLCLLKANPLSSLWVSWLLHFTFGHQYRRWWYYMYIVCEDLNWKRFWNYNANIWRSTNIEEEDFKAFRLPFWRANCILEWYRTVQGFSHIKGLQRRRIQVFHCVCNIEHKR